MVPAPQELRTIAAEKMVLLQDELTECVLGAQVVQLDNEEITTPNAAMLSLEVLSSQHGANNTTVL